LKDMGFPPFSGIRLTPMMRPTSFPLAQKTPGCFPGRGGGHGANGFRNMPDPGDLVRQSLFVA